MFSNSTKYAIRAIVHMLENQQNGKHRVVEMASKLEIPQPFLSKVLQQLAKSGVISSTKGRNGGFYLSEENQNRPLVDVIVCIEGRNVFDHCILGLKECSDENPCILHRHFKMFKESIEKAIKEQSIEDLIKYYST
ncbi:MAG: Rrf2 family transcriptional regulator [Bacteroidota bacterium]